MARQLHDHWVHGVSTFVEHPDHVTSIAHCGGSTVITQEKDPEGRRNWFHLAIPTPTKVADENIYLEFVQLRAHVNQNARIAEIHIWQDDKQIHIQNCNFVDERVDQRFNLGEEHLVTGAIELCVRVEFLGREEPEPIGTVWFISAGGRFVA